MLVAPAADRCRRPLPSTTPARSTTRNRVSQVRDRSCSCELGTAPSSRSDDVVLVNEHGEVTETTIANIAIRLDERWWTPPTTAGCLPGVERARLLGLGRLHERRLTVDDLRAAEAI